MKLEGKRTVLAIDDALYPTALKETPAQPAQLYVIGDINVLQNRGIAIVGTRKAAQYGIFCAGHFSELLANLKITLINGGALGCETAALEACIENGGKAIVVLPSGCDQIYPSENAELFQKVINCGGAVISEQAWNTVSHPHQYRARNRIIAGLSRAMLAVEAALPSGVFFLCDDALEASRDVWAVPGNINSPQSAGTNKLIQEGATPIIDDATFIDLVRF